MSEEDERRRELENRNAGLRAQIDDMLSDLKRKTEDLQQQQAEAAQRTFEVSSEDGMVTVKVDASGTVDSLTLAPKAFEKTSPDKLAEKITSVIREASGLAQQSLQAEFKPDEQSLPDLTDFVPGAPSLKGLLSMAGPLVQPPDPAAERERRAEDEQPSRFPRRSGSRAQPDYDAYDDFDDDFDEPGESFRGGRR